MPPRSIGPYQILSVVGRGGVGTVYRARHRVTGAAAAVKLLGPAPAADAAATRRLAREFEALARLDHPNVIRVFEAGVAEGYSFLAMELVEGLDLRSWLSPALDLAPAPTPSTPGDPAFGLEDLALEPDTESYFTGSTGDRGPGALRDFAALLDEPETDPGRLVGIRPSPGPRRSPTVATPAPPSAEFLAALNLPSRLRRLVHAVRQVCDALVYVHAQGLVHRDLKPSNIMVDDSRRVRLMDFGLVKPAHEQRAGGRVAVVGTYRYMAPEQARGDAVDGRADLYALGVVLWELAAGRPPFPVPGLRMRHLGATPAPKLSQANPGADPRLCAVTERLLQLDPGRRFQSAADVKAALPG